jgi:metallo-beta-lactamase family protein
MQLMEAGRIDETDIYVDSPLANKVLAVMQQHTNLLAPGVRATIKKKGGFLQAPYVHYITTQEESKDVMYDSSPGIVIASSGMGEGGRIIHHLKHSIDDPRCTVILVSFQAPGSLGARLMEPGPTARISGRDWNKWAEVISLRGFSGHADQRELMELLQPQVEAGARVALVHGEESNLTALQQAIHGVRPEVAVVAERGMTFPI